MRFGGGSFVWLLTSLIGDYLSLEVGRKARQFTLKCKWNSVANLC